MNTTTGNYKKISFFPGLNALRFIAAFLVVMHHSETIKRKNGIANLEWFGLFRNGGTAVSFFFVLSGFLITYLLLKEYGKTKDISIKQFYMKRVLRIWPLYYLLVIIGTIILPYLLKVLHVDYTMPYTLGQTWYYFVFFLPGLVMYYYGTHLLQPLWSIGVEEVFYLMWAPLVKFLRKYMLTMLISIIVVKMVLVLLGQYFIKNDLYNLLVNIYEFEAMSIGGLGAYFLYTNGEQLTKMKIFKRPFQFVLISLLVLYIIFHTNIHSTNWDRITNSKLFSTFVIDILFLYLIICVSVIESSIVKLRSKTLSFLGEISYGIYMYHMLIVFATVLFLKKYLLQMNPVICFIVYYIVVAFLVILISTLSKYFFENYFLRIKGRMEEKKDS